MTEKAQKFYEMNQNNEIHVKEEESELNLTIDLSIFDDETFSEARVDMF